MRVRLRGSGGAARWLIGYPWLTLLIASVFVGEFAPNPAYVQTAADDAAKPFVFALTAVGCVLWLRLPLLGVWFGPEDVRIRSWFRTTTVSVHRDLQCSRQAWSSWINDWNADGSGSLFNVLALAWTDDAGRRRAGVYYGTLAHWKAIRNQAAVIEAFAEAAWIDPSPELARGYARGAERQAVIDAIPAAGRRVRSPGRIA
ncbi:hypothetical protein [Agromyces binzhouensis]|uniref:Uncharacterized protein n=1 Tax=Agromyces binzhouensis TaxID=1817495 RepID=A0A4Q2JY66_9MICO|nr:hypothetical protein [Agromyces binzhouensis]RXZ51729.1 hypothetical protein ESO86_01080 [Agromyces binzhouensis]